MQRGLNLLRRTKLSLFVDDMTINPENSQATTDKLLELMKGLNRIDAK